MRHLLYLMFIAPYCYVTVPFLTYRVIKNDPLNGIPYLFAAL